MPLLPGLRVVRSPLHGYGVVATRDFAEGDLLADVEGVTWRDGDDWDDTYTLRITDSLWFDMVDQTRWINHSCEANAEVDLGADEQGEPWAKVYAWRDIAAGEEITFDYEFPPELAEPCHCGAPSCRGMIVRQEESAISVGAEPTATSRLAGAGGSIGAVGVAGIAAHAHAEG